MADSDPSKTSNEKSAESQGESSWRSDCQIHDTEHVPDTSSEEGVISDERAKKKRKCRASQDSNIQDSKLHFSEDEECLIIRMFNLVGERWSLIAGRIPGRTANEIEMYWNTRYSTSQ